MKRLITIMLMLLTVGAQAQTKEFLQKRGDKNKRINAIIANHAKRRQMVTIQ